MKVACKKQQKPTTPGVTVRRDICGDGVTVALYLFVMIVNYENVRNTFCVHNGLICTSYYVCVTYQARRYSVLAHYVRLIASRIGYG